MAAPSLVNRLLEAHVAFVLERMTGTALEAQIASTADHALDALSQVPVGTLFDAGTIKELARRYVSNVPATAAATTLVGAAAEAVHAGPKEPFALGELIARDHVESVVDEVLALSPIAEKVLDQLANSPLVATVASRFVGRVVGDVLAANRSVAEKIPGVGSLMSLGTSVGSKMIGAADKQLEQLLGDTAGKGASFAMRRLNKVVVDTLKDPMTREAVLQVWDLYSDQPLVAPSAFLTPDDAQRVAALLQEIVASGAPTEPVGALIDSMVDVFFRQYADHPVATLLEDLEISRDDVVSDLGLVVGPIVDALRADGSLETWVRESLEPFYSSPAVRKLLA